MGNGEADVIRTGSTVDGLFRLSAKQKPNSLISTDTVL
jgi:hypothetical protein